jgi:hypothetical protein
LLPSDPSLMGRWLSAVGGASLEDGWMRRRGAASGRRRRALCAVGIALNLALISLLMSALGGTHALAAVTPGPNDPVIASAISTSPYTLAGSDGVTWNDMDPTQLSITTSPSASQSTLLSANADLFTGTGGVNQDLGIFVSDNGGIDTLVAWEEAGGFAGTFSPNAAYVQTLFGMTSGHTYIFKLKWKSSISAPGATIYAGAGPIGGQFSPTSLAAETFPPGVVPKFATSTSSYRLANSDGSTWQDIDATNLTTTLRPGSNSTAVLGTTWPQPGQPDPQDPVALLDPKPRLASQCHVELMAGGEILEHQVGRPRKDTSTVPSKRRSRPGTRQSTNACNGYLAVPVFRSPFAALQPPP